MKFANKIFGAKLKQFLAEAQIKQKDLAEKLEVSNATVSLWVSGDFAPEEEKFVLICELLMKEPGQFFGQDSRPDLFYCADILSKLANLEPTELQKFLGMLSGLVFDGTRSKAGKAF